VAAYVYLIEEIPLCSSESGPWTKIGYSKNPPERRLNANLKRGNPRELRLAVVYEFESEQAAREAEQRAHNAFRQFAHQKEWFQISWQKVAYCVNTSAHWQTRSS
jgi:hypothetical protein